MKTRDKELKALQELPSTPNTLGQPSLSSDQFSELKALLLQLNEREVKDASSIDTTRIMEAGLGYVAGKAVVGILGKSTLEEKVDNLTKMVMLLINRVNGLITAGSSKDQVIKPIIMGKPKNTGGLQHVNPQKGTASGIPPYVQKIAGMGMKPINPPNAAPPTDPFLNNGLMM
ncbi:hypothetical protein D770_24745 [Flammeovirgaceae bacterium 311]|nr:hypothetical protein D770_24745 [Flammeovirgaceae bacterium 311]